MDTIKTILVPVDFDQHTDRLVEYALFVAEKFSASLQFVHVSEGFYGYALYEHPSFTEIEEGLRAHAQSEMTRLLERLASEAVACSGSVINGDIVDEILTLEKSKGVDMILIATHGKKGLERILLGSVAERVMKGATCPVLMFNPYHTKN